MCPFNCSNKSVALTYVCVCASVCVRACSRFPCYWWYFFFCRVVKSVNKREKKKKKFKCPEACECMCNSSSFYYHDREIIKSSSSTWYYNKYGEFVLMQYRLECGVYFSFQTSVNNQTHTRILPNSLTFPWYQSKFSQKKISFQRQHH